jgi:C_GCAxxG_C_C family probable redox protein
MKDKLTGLNDRDGKHYNCCESTLLIVNDHYPLPGFESNIMRASSLTGAGVAYSGSGCGAVVGMATALGLVYGSDGKESPEEFNEKRSHSRALIRPLMKEFRDTFGDVNCKGLTGLDFLVDEERARWSEVYDEREKAPVNCHTYIDWAAQRVLDTIEENKPS